MAVFWAAGYVELIIGGAVEIADGLVQGGDGEEEVVDVYVGDWNLAQHDLLSDIQKQRDGGVLIPPLGVLIEEFGEIVDILGIETDVANGVGIGEFVHHGEV